MAEDLFAPVLRMVGRTSEDRAAFLAWKADHDRQVAERAWDEAESICQDTFAAMLRDPLGTPTPLNPYRAALTTDERCWCGGPIGPRDPGDARGLGCLDNISHALLAATPSDRAAADEHGETGAGL